MENITKIIGYHTCKAKGEWGVIWANAPFVSESNKRQWLTQGYYFWTDSDHFAHKWGEKSIQGNYAIIQCTIEVGSNELLDLIGSLNDQIYFKELLDLFHNKLKKANPNAKSPTVNAIISFYRESAKSNKQIFPYIAIKAADKFSETTCVNFIDNKYEALPLLSRHQLCLFEVAAGCIKNRKPIYPEEFKSVIENIGG